MPQLQSKITKDVESKITKRQREYWLMEQMKGIRRELGIESDGKDKLVEKLKEKADKLAMPEAVRKVFDDEINKLAHLEPAASEFNVTRNYLDWLTQIPWGVRSEENFAIKHAVLRPGRGSLRPQGCEGSHSGIYCGGQSFVAPSRARYLCFMGPPPVLERPALGNR